jgi:hypothetical protein
VVSISSPGQVTQRLLRRALRTAKSSAFRLRNPELAAAIDDVREGHLTYLSVAALQDLAHAAVALQRLRIPGIYLEAGVARGGSSIVLWDDPATLGT